MASEFDSQIKLDPLPQKKQNILSGLITLTSKDQVIEIFKDVRKDKKQEMLE